MDNYIDQAPSHFRPLVEFVTPALTTHLTPKSFTSWVPTQSQLKSNRAAIRIQSYNKYGKKSFKYPTTMMSMKSFDDPDFQLTQNDYQSKLRYEQFKVYAKKQNSTYFEENPKFMKLFNDQLENDQLDSIVKNNTALYKKWMADYEEFKEQAQKDGEEVNMKDFFERNIYNKQTNQTQEEEDEQKSEQDAIEFFDTNGNKVSMKNDELFYIQSLMGKVDWEAFAEKNQKRLEKIKKVDAKVQEVKKLQKEQEKAKKQPVEEEEQSEEQEETIDKEEKELIDTSKKFLSKEPTDPAAFNTGNWLESLDEKNQDSYIRKFNNAADQDSASEIDIESFEQIEAIAEDEEVQELIEEITEKVKEEKAKEKSKAKEQKAQAEEQTEEETEEAKEEEMPAPPDITQKKEEIDLIKNIMADSEISNEEKMEMIKKLVQTMEAQAKDSKPIEKQPKGLTSEKEIDKKLKEFRKDEAEERPIPAEQPPKLSSQSIIVQELIKKGIAPDEKAALMIIQKVKQAKTKKEADLLKAPKYFQELFKKYPILKKFDLKEVMTKNYVRQFFLKVAKEQIYNDVNKSKLKLPDLKEVFMQTKFPIAFVLVGTIKTVFRFVYGYSLNPYFQLLKFSVYYYWLKESWKIGRANTKLQKRVKLYQELQKEVLNLGQVLQKAQSIPQQPVVRRWWPFQKQEYDNYYGRPNEVEEDDRYWPFEQQLRPTVASSMDIDYGMNSDVEPIQFFLTTMMEDVQMVPEAQKMEVTEMVKEMHKLYELKMMLNYLDRFDKIMGTENLNIQFN